MNLTDARIVLTGAAGGIGSATAAWLANAGAKLVLADLKQQAIDQVAERIGADHVLAAVAADVTTEGGRSALVAAARKHDVNVLINAAGVNPFGPAAVIPAVPGSAPDAGATPADRTVNVIVIRPGAPRVPDWASGKYIVGRTPERNGPNTASVTTPTTAHVPAAGRDDPRDRRRPGADRRAVRVVASRRHARAARRVRPVADALGHAAPDAG